MPYTIAIFDLDGTLLDTLDDLHAATNTALANAGYPPRTREEVRAFVGNGVERLIRLALPAGTDEPTIRSTLADFKTVYARTCTNRTAPYPGIIELLDDLRARGVRIAVVSNKFDAAVKSLCARYFGDRIEIAVGEREADGVRKKPAPDTVYEALGQILAPNEHSPSAVAHGKSTVEPRWPLRCFSGFSPISEEIAPVTGPVSDAPDKPRSILATGTALPPPRANLTPPESADLGSAADLGSVVYIGDSEVDILTARNAGIPCLTVTWGFRDEATLRAAGATVLPDTPAELLRAIVGD